LVCATQPPCAYPGGNSCNCVPGGGGGGGDMWVCGACPGTQPADASACTSDGLLCDYGSTACTCRRQGGGGGGTAWTCITPPPPCPTNQPTAGSSCVPGTGGGGGGGFGTCNYGPVTCRCLPATGDAGDEWSCN
jgi:hypothetical protein